jgi:iron(II)-dependent oxidoreductase
MSRDWEPLYPMLRYGVFASRWPLNGRTVWTIVNRNEYDVDGPQMEIPVAPGMRYFDLYGGTELRVQKDATGKSVLSFALESNGFGAIFASTSEPDAKIQRLMAEMKQLSSKPLASFSSERNILKQEIVPIAATAAASSLAEGMVQIPEADFVFKVSGIEIEGFNDAGVDVEYPWENAPRRFHEHPMHIKSFYMDKYPVTNAEYKKFLDAAHYHPKDDLNFLEDWKGGTFPSGWDNRPVTWVSLEDARAYAAWTGKRLPHEWEWQYAAQGNDGRVYPWGNQWDASAVPEPDKNRTMRGADTVDAHPKGASPFGVMDLVGNVWQWTEEFTDERTRGGILRGGSYYQPQGSIWYFPQAYKLSEHGKLLLMGPSMDRSGALGFRLVQDAR